MKATIKIDFDLPKEKSELYDYLHGPDYIGILQEFDNYLRGRLKHESLSEEQYKICEEIRDKLYEEATDLGVKIWN